MERNENFLKNLKVLLFSALYSWKKIVFVALLCGILLGTMQVYLKWQESWPEEKVRSHLSERDRAQLEKQENKLSEAEQYLDIQIYYLEHSILMNIDYHATYQAAITYTIQPESQPLLQTVQPETAKKTDTEADSEITEESDPKQLLLHLYENRLLYSDLQEKIAQELGEETRYLKELIRISATDEDGLYITVRHSQKEMVSRIASLLIDNLEDLQADLNETAHPHNVTHRMEIKGPYEDLGLYEEQKINHDLLATRSDNLVLMQDELQRVRANLGLTLKAIAVSEGNAFVAVCKWLLIGCVAGGVLTALLIAIQSVLSDQITSEKKFTSVSSLRLLGTLSREKKPKDKVHTLLLKLEGRGSSSTEKNTKLVAQHLAEQVGIGQNILLCSTTTKNDGEFAARNLRKYIPDAVLIPVNKLPRDSKSMAMLRNADAVVITVVLGVTREKEITAIAKRAAYLNKTIAGVIIVD